jgi:hypothetical protein
MIQSPFLKLDAIIVLVPSLFPGSILDLTIYREDKCAHKEREGEESANREEALSHLMKQNGVVFALTRVLL